jgi:hypothetical protein
MRSWGEHNVGASGRRTSRSSEDATSMPLLVWPSDRYASAVKPEGSPWKHALPSENREFMRPKHPLPSEKRDFS